MRVALASDVHIEFGQLDIRNTENADVLLLAGDIIIAHDLFDRDDIHTLGGREFKVKKSEEYHDFFSQCCKEFPKVVYIAGNHEHYHGDFAETHKILRERLSYLENLLILDKEVWEHEGITFVGGTLWTDFNKEDPITMWDIRKCMNDFVIIKNSGVQTLDKSIPKFRPSHALEDHKAMLEVLKDTLAKEEVTKVVVVGHHAPSKGSNHPKYTDFVTNGGYSSDLNDFIIDNPKIVLWVHGHTHESYDYMVGPTRILCNPRGYYNREAQAYSWKLLTVEV